MRALGAFLTDAGDLDRGGFEAVVRERLAAANRDLAAWLEDRLREAGGGPSWWAADVRRYVAELAVASDREDYPIALDVAPAGATGADLVAEARASTRDAVRRFGQLLTHWPAMVEEARALRAGGQPLAIPVSKA
jgi:urease accessory protein UreF